MSLNCKIGDLAIIVVDEEGSDLGKIVRIVEPGDDWSYFGDSRPHWACDTLGQKFVISAPFVEFSDGVELIDIPDAYLRPLRDEEGEDETLTWAPSPTAEFV